MRIRTALVLGLAILLSYEVFGQTAKPEFEVADVRVNKLADNPTAEFLPGGQVNLRGVTMKTLIGIGWKESRVLPEVSAMAVQLTPVTGQFNVNADDYLKGGPSWLNADRFDVIAKAPAGTPTDTDPADASEATGEPIPSGCPQRTEGDEGVCDGGHAKGGAKLKAAAAGSESAGAGQPVCARSISQDNVYHRDCRNMTMAERSGSATQLRAALF